VLPDFVTLSTLTAVNLCHYEYCRVCRMFWIAVEPSHSYWSYLTNFSFLVKQLTVFKVESPENWQPWRKKSAVRKSLAPRM